MCSQTLHRGTDILKLMVSKEERLHSLCGPLTPSKHLKTGHSRKRALCGAFGVRCVISKAWSWDMNVGTKRANRGSGDPPSLLTGQWVRATRCHTLLLHAVISHRGWWSRSPPTFLILSVPPRIFFLFPFKHTLFFLLLLLPPPSFFLPVDRVSAWDGISPVCRTHGKNFRKCTPHLPTHQKNS